MTKKITATLPSGPAKFEPKTKTAKPKPTCINARENFLGVLGSMPFQLVKNHILAKTGASIIIKKGLSA